MKKENNINEDLLKSFLNGESSEKAPDGFTERMMNQLTAEVVHIRKNRPENTNRLVPLVSAACVAILVILAIITGSTGNGMTDTDLLKFLNNISISLPDFPFEYTGLRIPEITYYIMSLSFFLLILDLYLFRYFRKVRSMPDK